MLKLPTYDRTIVPYKLTGIPLHPRAPEGMLTRTAFAAAHVVSDPLAEDIPWEGRPAVDWENTLRFRHWLWDQGLGLAEAMDTAQRSMGLDWLTAKELIERTMAEARAHPLGPRVASGAGTDQLQGSSILTEDTIIAAYEEQMAAIEAAGSQIIIMATRALPAIGADADCYTRVYNRLIGQVAEPVILHWLGEMFDPELRGYWGSSHLATATDVVLSIIAENRSRIDGIKLSLLDQAREETIRRRLPTGVRLYTGDDFNYTALIRGDGEYHSHALLGAFAAIAPAATRALEALARADDEAYCTLFEPTVPLSRELFKPPTRFYKAGIAFLAWLNGVQDHFIMPMGFQASREITHYAEVYRLADTARMLCKPDLAEARMATLLSLYGIHQD